MIARLRPSSDSGTAVVEFVWLAVLLLIPLTYVVLAVVTVQRAAFAETAAARDAARAYATAGSDALGEQRAETAVAVAMRDQGLHWTPTGRVVDCGPCTYAPGTAFEVHLHAVVPLPFVPSWLCGHGCAGGIGVNAEHTERIDCYVATGAAPDPREGGAC